MTKTIRQYRHKFLVAAHKQMRNLFRFLGPTVGTCALIEKEGQILLVRRTENGKLDIPGGLVNWGETTEQACHREVFEETGYQIEIVSLLGIYSWVRKDYCNVTVPYIARVVGGSASGSSEGEPLWLPPPFQAEEFHPGMERFLFDYLAGKRCFSASNLADDG